MQRFIQKPHLLICDPLGHKATDQALVAELTAIEGIGNVDSLADRASKSLNLTREKEFLHTILREYHVAIVRSATELRESILKTCNRLKLIVRVGEGTDNIDKVFAENKGITVKNTPGISTHSVADLTMLHILHSARRDTVGFELSRKTLGVVGMGKIGSEVARRAQGFGMGITFFDEYSEARAPEQVDAARSKKIDGLLRSADIVSLHVPLTDDTRHLIDARELDWMQEGATIINTARGPLIRSAALLERLNSGHIGHAGLDVVEDEPRGVKKSLENHPHALVTKHIGAGTVETKQRGAAEIVQLVREFVREWPQVELGVHG